MDSVVRMSIVAAAMSPSVVCRSSMLVRRRRRRERATAAPPNRLMVEINDFVTDSPLVSHLAAEQQMI